MLYIVKRVMALGRSADGSPYSISFENYFGKKFCLLCPRSDAAQQTGSHAPQSVLHAASLPPSAYWPPVLETYTKLKRKAAAGDHAQQEVHIDWNKESKTIAWREARKILRKLRRHMIGLDADQQDIYEALLHVTKNEGRT